MAHSLPPPNELCKWNLSQVQEWLQQSGLGECVEVFNRRNINGEALLDLTEQQLLFWTTELKIKHRIQITKYLNQYREKEKLLINAKEKILDQVRRRSTGLPPPLPQVDYKWDSTEDDQENPWGSDFESDSDEEYENDFNGNISHVPSNSLNIPGAQNESNKTELSTPQSSPSQQLLKVATVPELIQLPAQPMIPRRKNKPLDDSYDSPKEHNNENLPSSTSTVAKKPVILPKPSTPHISSPNSQIDSHKSPQRNSIIRPSEQPPPPPVKPQLPELKSCLPSSDEYEVPNSLPFNFHLPPSESRSTSNQSLNHALESIDTPEDESIAGSVDENMGSGSSETSSVSGTSTPLSPCYDRPKIPPRLVPGQQLVPPPLPRKPSSSKFSLPSDMPNIRTHDKPVPLPTRIPKMDENGNRMKDGKSFGVSLKSKIATLLSSDKSARSPENNSSNLTSSALSLNETSEASPALMKVKSQEIIGRTGSPIPRTSMEETISMQNRPLPPVPPVIDTELSRPPLSSSSSSSSSCESAKEGIENFAWFHPVERDVAEQMLKETESGNYIVRPSRRAGESSPFTLSMQYNGRVYHLNIRQKPNCLFALGKEKSSEKTFASVEELIEYHSNEPIVLTVKGVSAGKTCLLFSPEKR